MKVLYIGAGFVGACSAAVSADSGHTTLVYDINSDRVQKLGSGDRDTIESCLFEEGLGDLLIRNGERITFTDDYTNVENFLDECDAVFMCLPTPEVGETGESDLTYYKKAATQLGEAMAKRCSGDQSKYILIVNKSTVPIRMLELTHEMMDELGVKNYGVASNPEFLVEGKAVEGSIHPDRVVVGIESAQDRDIMRTLYQRFYDASGIGYIEVSPKEAEAGKLLANFYLFMKVATCFDVIGRVTEAFPDINFEQVRSIITSDKRIGGWGFYDSLYAGGSCLIKDARSLSHQLQTAGKNASLVNEVYLANRRQLELFFSRAETEAHIDWSGKTVALLGLSFKQQTNDIRNTPSLDLVTWMQEKGVAKIQAYDPAAMDWFSSEHPASDTLTYVADEHAALADADVVIIATDWPQFRALGNTLQEVKPQLLMDGRRILHHEYTDLQKSGISVVAVGSPFLPRA